MLYAPTASGTVTAVFELIEYTVTASPSYAGIGEVSGSGTGYLRIEDKSLPGRSRYITLEGKSYYGLPKSSRERLTHYYILKREEM